MIHHDPVSIYADEKPGTLFPLFSSNVVRQDFILAFADAVMDFNPIHCDVNFARRSGFSNTIAHGMLSISFVEQALRRLCGPTWRLLQIDGRFTNVLHIGKTVFGFAEHILPANPAGLDPVRVKFHVQDAEGIRILTGNAYLEIKNACTDSGKDTQCIRKTMSQSLFQRSI